MVITFYVKMFNKSATFLYSNYFINNVTNNVLQYENYQSYQTYRFKGTRLPRIFDAYITVKRD